MKHIDICVIVLSHNEQILDRTGCFDCQWCQIVSFFIDFSTFPLFRKREKMAPNWKVIVHNLAIPFVSVNKNSVNS